LYILIRSLGAMKFCLIAAIFGCAAADVSLDTEKLTDFTAEFDASVKNFPVGREQAELVYGEILGKVHLNLLAEKLKFSYGIKQFHGPHWQGNTDSPSGPPEHQPFGILSSGAITKGSGEIVIDGPAGVATITQQVKADASADGHSVFEMDMNYCFHVKLPANFAPPGGMLKQRADYMFPRIEQELNEMPHTQTANGDLVYSRPEGRGGGQYDAPIEDESFTIKSDGSPVSWHVKRTCDAACMNAGWQYASPEEVSLTVNSFTAGAGEVTPLSCIDSSVTNLSEQPGIMHAAVVFDTFMEQFAQSSGLNLPSLQPLIEQQILLAENVTNTGAQQQSWMVALLAGVAGMAGGAVVLALDKASRGHGSHHPLLSEA